MKIGEMVINQLSAENDVAAWRIENRNGVSKANGEMATMAISLAIGEKLQPTIIMAGSWLAGSQQRKLAKRNGGCGCNGISAAAGWP